MEDIKFKSRTFACWITSTVLLVLSLVVNCIIKTDLMAEVCKILAEGYTWITAIYLGANVASKFAFKGNNTTISDDTIVN